MIESVAFSLSGRLFATGLFDGTVIVWHADTGAKLSTFSAGRGETIALGFATADYLITGNTGEGVCLRDAGTGAELMRYQVGDRTPVGIFALSPSRKLLLIYDDYANHLFDAANGAFIRTMDEAGSSAAFSANDQYAAIDALWGDVTLNRVSDGQRVQHFRSPGGSGGAESVVDISPDWQYLLACHVEVHVWQAKGGLMNKQEKYRATVARFTPDSRKIVCGSQSGQLVMWDFVANREIWQRTAHTREILALDLSPDGKTVLAGAFDGTAVIHDLNTGQEILRVTI